MNQTFHVPDNRQLDAASSSPLLERIAAAVLLLVRAATQDREMLAALGVNVPMVYAAVFTIGSALAGVGGALAAPRIALVPGMDATIINECFIIVIIGGLGNMWGSFLGALAFGFVVQFGTVLAPNWQDVLPYLLMLVVLIVRPWGLLGRPEAGH